MSDVITFHAYTIRKTVEEYSDSFETFGRPIMITEWMARSIESRFGNQIGLFHDRKVGCFNWGLVQGRSQTHLPWPQTVTDTDNLDDAEWFHDVFRPDGSSYDPSEVELILALTARKNA